MSRLMSLKPYNIGKLTKGNFRIFKDINSMLRTDQMWYKVGGVVMALAHQLNISPEMALGLFYRSKTCDDLHDPETELYTFSDNYIADEVIAELRGL